MQTDDDKLIYSFPKSNGEEIHIRVRKWEGKLYIDGVFQTPLTTTASDNNSTNFGNTTLYFMSEGGSAAFTKGQLDDVRIYNRALTAGEILRLYNMGR